MNEPNQPPSAEPKPCPWCGGTKIRTGYVPNTGGNIHFENCSQCGADGPRYNPNKVPKFEQWNRRTPQPETAKEVDYVVEVMRRERAMLEDKFERAVEILRLNRAASLANENTEEGSRVMNASSIHTIDFLRSLATGKAQP